MGFRETQKVYRLEFEDDFEGLVVKVTVPAFGKVLELEQQVGGLAELVGKRAEDFSPEDVAAAVASSSDMVDAFLDNLVEWNVEDAAGAPIPATREGLARVSSTLGRHVLTTWWEFANGTVPDPKDQPSSGGSPSLEASLPMEPLSPSRAS